MTATLAPAPATTTTGAPLPLLALPRGGLLTVNEKDLTGGTAGYTNQGS
ncbi:MAG: hypothetical protein K0U76_14885 [Actinomycetia bacterium]|nr:hypothetical protein [Actinomycetes bacterium]MCH9702638.1 hypothetical protein [Actinomycetes bacterium]MCH9759846.1 hypothetical protein [Actinomycetes bacterium]